MKNSLAEKYEIQIHSILCYSHKTHTHTHTYDKNKK
jgi:hypothetical protein